MTAAASGVLGDIAEHVPQERILSDPAVTAGLSHDEAEWAPVGEPLAVVRAAGAGEVREVVRACYAHGVPVLARGAGTGLSGGANAVDGCVVVALDRMNSVVEINPLERLAVVQPGVVNDDLRVLQPAARDQAEALRQPLHARRHPDPEPLIRANRKIADAITRQRADVQAEVPSWCTETWTETIDRPDHDDLHPDRDIDLDALHDPHADLPLPPPAGGPEREP